MPPKAKVSSGHSLYLYDILHEKAVSHHILAQAYACMAMGRGYAAYRALGVLMSKFENKFLLRMKALTLDVEDLEDTSPDEVLLTSYVSGRKTT